MRLVAPRACGVRNGSAPSERGLGVHGGRGGAAGRAEGARSSEPPGRELPGAERLRGESRVRSQRLHPRRVHARCNGEELLSRRVRRRRGLLQDVRPEQRVSGLQGALRQQPCELRELSPPLRVQPRMRERTLRRSGAAMCIRRRMSVAPGFEVRRLALPRVRATRRLQERRRTLHRRRMQAAVHARRELRAHGDLSGGRMRQDGLSDRECAFVLADPRALCAGSECFVPCRGDWDCATASGEVSLNICRDFKCVFAGCESDTECRAALGLERSSLARAVCR